LYYSNYKNLIYQLFINPTIPLGGSSMKNFKNMNKPNKIILICLEALLSLYFIPSLYVSVKVFEIEPRRYHNYGQNNPYKDILSDEIFYKMSRRDLDPNVTNRKFTTFPITYFWDGEARSIYWYSQEVYNSDGKNISGSWNIPVYITLKLVDGKWVI
jgi:hypothetical protein